MSKYMINAFEYVRFELLCAESARLNGEFSAEFKFLERAHIISQFSTILHVYVHYKMGCWAIRNIELKELVGQLLRSFGALILTPIGFIPEGNPGGANVPAYKAFPIPHDLKVIIESCKNKEYL